MNHMRCAVFSAPFNGVFRSLAVVLVLLLYACNTGKVSSYQKSSALLDTLVTITVVSESRDKAEKAINDAFSVIERFGRLIDFFSEDSELSEINRNAGIREVRVSPDTLGVIERAVYISSISGGAFDATIGPEIRMWDFHNKKKPSDVDIRNKLHLVDYRNIIINRDRSTVFLKKKNMLVDLGGIAKGYAADLALATLKGAGFRNGIVAAAGDIRVFGKKPDGSLWNIGIQNPRQKGEADALIAKMKLSEKAVSTSGDYERYFIEDGKRYHHILDPKTGLPSPLCRSVTVVSDNSVFADGFSTAIFVLGPEKGLKLAEDRRVDAFIIDSSGKVHMTPGMKGLVTLETNN